MCLNEKASSTLGNTLLAYYNYVLVGFMMILKYEGGIGDNWVGPNG